MHPLRKVNISITNRTIIRVIIWAFLAILAYRFMGRISHVLILIFAALFLALALNPVVGLMSRHLRLQSRVRATAAAYIMIVVIIIGFFALITPPLVRQTRDFINNAPQTIQNFQSKDNSLSRAFKRYHIDEKLTKGAKDFASNYGNFGSTLLDTGKRIIEAVISILVVLILAFMMLVEGPSWVKLLLGNVADKDRERYQKLITRIYRAVTSFVNGQVILAIIAGIFAFITLEIASRILNVTIHPIALAGIVAMLGIIPLLGNPIASVLVTLICLLSSGTLALVMLIYFIIYFFIESHSLQPYVQSRLNELTPLTVLMAAMIGVGFGGFLGAIVAIPAASTIKILLEDHFEHRRQLPHPEKAYD